MAKNVITLTVTLNKEQAQRQIEEMKVGLKGMKDELSVVQNKLNDRDLWGPKDTFEGLKSREKSLTKQIKLTEKAIQTGVREIEGYEKKLSNISSLSYNTLTQMRTSYTNSLKNMRKETKEDMEVYEEKLAALQKIRDEIAKQDIDLKGGMTTDRAKEILAKPEKFDTKSIKDATEAIARFRDIKQADSEEWHHWNGYVNNGKKFLEDFNSKIKEMDMSALQESVKTGHISDKDLNVVIRYWESMIDGTDKGVKKLSDYKSKLEEARQLQQQRIQQKGQSVTRAVNKGDLGISLSELQQQLKTLQEYRNTIDSTKPDAFKEIDNAISRITATIKESQPGFMSFETAMAKAADIKNFRGTIDELETIKRTIQEGTTELNLRGKSLDTLKEAQLRLDDIANKYKEIQHLNSQKKIDAVSQAMKSEEGLASLSAGDTEEAIRLAKELQKSHDVTGKEYQKLSVFITNAEAQLKKWNESAKQTVMNRQMQNLAHLSRAALEEQQKFWQGAVDGAERGSKAYDYAFKRLKKVNDQMAVRQRAEANAYIKDINVGNIGGNIQEMQQRLKLLQEYRTTIDATKPNAYIEVDKAINKLTQHIKESQAGFISFEEALTRASDMEHFDGTVEDLDKIQKVIKEGMNSKLNLMNDKDVETMKMAQLLLDDILKKQKEIASINAQEKIDTVSGNLGGSSVGEIEEAIKLAKELQSTYAGDSDEFKKLAKFIEDGTSTLNTWNAKIKEAAMDEQFKKLTTLSTNALDQQKKYWQEVFNAAEKGTAAYIKSEKKLQDINKEISNRENARTGHIMDNLKDYSVSEIESAIKSTEKLRDAQKAGSNEYDIYANKINKAKEYLQSYIDLSTQISMEDKWSNLSSLSANALNEQKKYWQEMINGAVQGSKELADYQNKLEAVTEEEQKRLRARTQNAIQTPTDHSVKEIQEAIKATEQLRDAQKPGSDEWKRYGDEIKKAKDILNQFNAEIKEEAMSSQLNRPSSLSTNALAEQKKYWQEMINATDTMNPKLIEYRKNLQTVVAEERTRTKIAADAMISNVQSGNWDKTIAETEEAVKLIQEYKKQLSSTSDASILKDANNALEILNNNLAKAKEGLMDIDQAKRIAKEVEQGVFSGTSDEISKAKKALEDYRKSLNIINRQSPDEIEKIDNAIANLSRSVEIGGKNLKSLNAVLADLDSASMEELQTAAKQLQQQLQSATRGVGDYARTAAQLRRVNREIEQARHEWEGQESLFIRMTKRLTVYMAAYGSLSAITGYIKDLGKANLQLSDSIADVAKTTGLLPNEIAKLGSEIRAIDTRTAQEQLYELAAAAGQLGIKSTTEIAGFVRAANMITVALNELGTDATTQLMKIATLTGESSSGTEKALLSIGSAINELTANSAAAAGPIVDLMNRMGGIAAQSKISSAQMAAIGATADALGQSVEITGTSMNKFLATLMSSSDQIAYALNMDAAALRNLINSGKTMDAVIAIFERMNDMGGLGSLAGVMGDLGSEGARMTQVLAAMASKVDFLKSQIDISTKAYEEATSIQDEYNVKNENAIAILERMGNAIKELFVNNWVVDILTETLRVIYQFFSYLGEGTFLAKALVSTITSLTAALLANRIAWIQNMQAMSWTRQLVVLRTAWRALSSAVVSGLVAVSNFTKSIPALVKGLLNAQTRTVLFANAFKSLKTLLAANWLTAVIAGLTALGTWIYKTVTYVSEAAKATAKYNRELQEETDKVDQLFRSLQRLGTKEGDRARIINSINQQYEKYLGFMLDEKDSAEKLAAAHQLINAELRNRMALNLQTSLQSSATNDYATELEKTIAKIGTSVENIKVRVTKENGVKEDRMLYTSDVMTTVSQVINDSVYAAFEPIKEEVNGEIVYRQNFSGVDLQSVKESIKEALIKQMSGVDIYHNNDVAFESTDTAYAGKVVFARIESYIEDMLNERVKFQKKLVDAEEQANIEMRSFTQDALTKRKNFLEITKNEIENAKKNSDKLEEKLLETKKEAKKYKKGDESEEAKTARSNYEQAERNLRNHYTKMVDNANDYVAATQKLMEDHNASLTENETTRMNQEIKMYQDFAKETAKLVPGMDPWGKDRDVKDWREFTEIVTNIDTSSATALAAAFKKIKDEAANFPDNIEQLIENFQLAGVDEISIQKLGLKDSTSVAEQIFQWEKQIREKLRTKFHRNTSLGFIFDEDGSNSQKRKAQEQYRAAIAALEAYFNERETLIQKKGFEEGKTQVQINQDLERLQTEKLNDEIQLRKLLLNDYYKESTFNPSKYKGVISGTDYFKEKNFEYLAALRRQLEKWGVAMEDGMKKQLTDRMVKLSEQVLKLREKINKILLEDNFSEQVKQQYLDSLQELGLLFGLTEQELVDQDKQEGLRRLAYMREWAKESYNLNAQQLQSKVEQEEAFSSWRIGRRAEDYEALLIQLRKFHDDQEEADRKAAERRKKIFDNSEKGIQLQKAASSAEKIGEAGVKDREDNVKFWDRFKNMDLVTDDLIDEKQVEVAQAQLSLYQAKIDASQLYIDQIKKEMEAEHMKARMAIAEAQNELNRKKMMHADTTQAEADLYAAKQYYESLKRQESLMTKDKEEEIAQARADQVEQYQNIADRYLAIEQNKIARMKEYTDAVVDFSYQMGEAAFGEVEDRQEAGKQLIKSLLTTLKEHLQIKLTELAMEAMFANQSNAMRGNEMIANLTASGMEAGATVAIEGVKATAKETGKLGWKGLIVGAAISAALSGLLGLAMGALNKKKSEIASTTGASTGRLATGMLTYKKGNYPVLGNDGQIYNAKYEGSEMKTGVYGGGAHFGIFSEKKPEAIIDGDTTQRLILYHPDIWQSILTLSKTGRLDRGMRTFASGNMSDFASMDMQPTGDNTSVNLQNEMMEQLRTLMSANMTLLNKLATEGVQSRIDMYGEGGLYKSMKKAETFASKRGYR